ncbi:MAG: SEC-C domain-containing protein, partial [Patescibacteria group bacterium]|nr:SEC-C domain-containing protein [Patescibacteria group bacterium]
NSISPAAIIDKKIVEYGREPFLQAARIVLLQTIDMFWVEHLEVMDYTRGSVNLRAYGQRDPLVEYKKEGLRLFREMQAAVHGQVMRILPNIVPVVNGVPMKSAAQSDSRFKNQESRIKQSLKDIQSDAQFITSGDGSNKAAVHSGNDLNKKEPGRNDPCWCGSGKKYKKCHGAGK